MMTEPYSRLRMSLMGPRLDSQPLNASNGDLRKAEMESRLETISPPTSSGSPLPVFISSHDLIGSGQTAPQTLVVTPSTNTPSFYRSLGSDAMVTSQSQIMTSLNGIVVISANGSQTDLATLTANNERLTGGCTTEVRSCSGCGSLIEDRFLLHAMDRYWHSSCLKCSCCQAQLGEIGKSCFTRQGMILCKNDYVRMFGSSGTCTACSQSIPASEFVMKAQGSVFHLSCFACVSCKSRLVPGDRYSNVPGMGLVCEHDYARIIKQGQIQALRANHKVF